MRRWTGETAAPMKPKRWRVKPSPETAQVRQAVVICDLRTARRRRPGRWSGDAAGRRLRAGLPCRSRRPSPPRARTVGRDAEFARGNRHVGVKAGIVLSSDPRKTVSGRRFQLQALGEHKADAVVPAHGQLVGSLLASICACILRCPAGGARVATTALSPPALFQVRIRKPLAAFVLVLSQWAMAAWGWSVSSSASDRPGSCCPPAGW